MCFLPVCKSHIILLGETEELLYKMDTFCVTYQKVDCVQTVFKYRFRGKNTAKSGNVIDNVQGAFSFNQRIRGKDKMLIIAKRGS